MAIAWSEMTDKGRFDASLAENPHIERDLRILPPVPGAIMGFSFSRWEGRVCRVLAVDQDAHRVVVCVIPEIVSVAMDYNWDAITRINGAEWEIVNVVCHDNLHLGSPADKG